MRRRSTRPTTLLLRVGAGLVIVGAAALALAYFVLFPTSSPKRFALAGGTAVSPPVAGLAGRWKVTAGSAAGYRVRERLAFLPAQSDAVGRTSAIAGTATFTGSTGALTVAAAAFTADLTALTSDNSMRDARIHSIGLQTDQYPTAVFKLATPVRLPAGAASGRTVDVSLGGDLTIHGTSRREVIPVQLRLSGTGVEATGSLTFPWSNFKMTAPSIGGFVTVTDRATMEFDLHLRRAA